MDDEKYGPTSWRYRFLQYTMNPFKWDQAVHVFLGSFFVGIMMGVLRPKHQTSAVMLAVFSYMGVYGCLRRRDQLAEINHRRGETWSKQV